MRTTLCSGLLVGLCCLMGSPSALAGEVPAGGAAPMPNTMSAHMRALANADGEAKETSRRWSLVKEGVLGTVNVLRELDVKTWSNLVKVTCTGGSNPEATIDGSGACLQPKADSVVLTYTLPGPRTVSSLAIAHASGGPGRLTLEGSSDGGKTWFEIFKVSKWLKVFKPVQVNALRLTQEGGDLRIKEVYVYADPEVALPLFGGKDSGAFGFMRSLWYADKLKLVWSPENKVWTTMWAAGMGINRFPETLLFKAGFPTQHDGGFGDAVEKGKRLYLRFDLDTACPMNAGLIGMHDGPKLGLHPAEFYTANGRLDPGVLKGSSIEDLTGQGWILQKAWDKDPEMRKEFQFAHPGKFNQMLVVWDAFKEYENDRWCRMEVFGAETPGAPVAPENPQK